VTTSVVILSYRPGDWLAAAVKSVIDQADEVVVVDNGSPAATASLQARRWGARVLRSERNLGFAGGVNLGVTATTGDVIALLNDDAVAGTDWLARAQDLLGEREVAAVAPKVRLAVPYREIVLQGEELRAPGDPRVLGRQVRSVKVDGNEVLTELLGGIYPLEESGGDRWRWTQGSHAWYVPLPADASNQEVEVLMDGAPAPSGPTCRLINSAGIYLRADGYAGDLGLGAPDDGRFDRRSDRFALSGTALAFRAETWHRIGGLAGGFFAYYEDIDWCWRANLAGFRLVYDPSSTVDHLRSATSGGASAVRVMAERNRTLSMVRSGPALHVAQALAERWQEGADGGVRAGIARRLPWAVGTRITEAARRASRERPTMQRARRIWTGRAHAPTTRASGATRTPSEVWARWAGVDNTWDDGPYRSDW
jgi:GT2 family glycosyltransferase